MAFKYTEEQLNKLDKELLIHLFLGMQEQMEELTRQTQSLSHLPGRRKTSRSFIRRKACPASTGGETTSGCFLCVPKIK